MRDLLIVLDRLDNLSAKFSSPCHRRDEESIGKHTILAAVIRWLQTQCFDAVMFQHSELDCSV